MAKERIVVKSKDIKDAYDNEVDAILKIFEKDIPGSHFVKGPGLDNLKKLLKREIVDFAQDEVRFYRENSDLEI
jgi:hypothetical protein